MGKYIWLRMDYLGSIKLRLQKNKKFLLTQTDQEHLGMLEKVKVDLREINKVIKQVKDGKK
jgi:hypothetical protein